MRDRLTPIALLAAAAFVAGCGGGDETAPTTTVALSSTATATTQATSTSSTVGATEPPAASEPPGPAETAAEDPRVNALERRAARDRQRLHPGDRRRDGARVCALLAPGAIDAVELPRPAGSCAAGVDASLGYRDPRGLPVWSGSDATAIRVAELDGAQRSARLIATVVTTYADRDEASVEDDVIYLVRDDAGWLVAKPSATLYRALGVADVPPTVLAPPG